MDTNNTHKRRSRTRRQRVVRFVVSLFAWISAILIYYVGFSVLFDTPHEHQLREANNKLRNEYNAMAERYDSLEMILDNITARDKGVFRILFESDPYDLDTEQSEKRLSSSSSSSMHVCMYVHVCVCLCVCMCLCVCVFTWLSYKRTSHWITATVNSATSS